MTSQRVKHVWKRLCAWYGADVIERKYGVEAPEDWREAIDAIDRGRLDAVLSDLRSKYTTWPPSLFEFEQIAKAKPIVQRGPTVQEQLCEFVLRNRPLTMKQIAAPWTYVGTGNPHGGEGFAITGVIVSPDGDFPGYRVTMLDVLGGVAA